MGPDGCAAAVPVRSSAGPRPEGQENGPATLSSRMGRKTPQGRGGQGPGREATGTGSDTFPAFVLGGWRFVVKTRDHLFIRDLEAFAREIAPDPRADRRFTYRLLQSTEEGKLGGWAWQKERAGSC